MQLTVIQMFNPNKIIELENNKKNTDKKFTVSQLLRFVPLTAPAYRDIKDGISMPKVTILERIAIFYGVDMNCFFTGMKPVAVTHDEIKVTEVNNEFLLDRIEKQAIRINKLEEELAIYKVQNKSYSLQNVQDLSVAEKQTELKKNK